MKKYNYLLTIAALILGALASGCTGPPNPGFRVETTIRQVGPMGLPVTVPHSGVGLRGSFLAADGATTGNVMNFIGNSGAGAQYDVKGGRAPGVWALGETSGPCGGQTIQESVSPGGRAGLLCDQFAPLFRFNASPSSIDADAPPSTVEVTGSGLSTAYGMPHIDYYDWNGTLVGSQQASQVSADGTWMTGPPPDLSGVFSGGYVLKVYNADGTYLGDGWAEVNRYYEPPPPPDPGDGGGGSCGCPRTGPCMPCYDTY
jgi:hypothetical protein